MKLTRDNQLAAHRVPPQLIGIIPPNTDGFGSRVQAASVFARHEIEPLQARFMALNEWLDEEVIAFEPYALTEGESAAWA
ncbi:hypothetical protein R0381_002582 [Jeongeupia wiesaeckerbachi]|uniref:hypothetical protein n=1 Tax=Jeongeupia wiesaeckerbachi TaxID=3051218 RepID=UPI003D809514